MKKVSNIFTSKVFLVFITTLLQIGIWAGLVYLIELIFQDLGFAENRVIIIVYLGGEVMGIIMSIYIMMQREHMSYKVLWLLFFIIAPTIAIFCYIFFGRHKIKKVMRKNNIRSQVEVNKMLETTDFEKQLIASVERETSNTCKLVARTGGFPAFADTHSKFFNDISLLWTQCLADLKTAEKFIYIDMYIIRDGEFWSSIRDVLVEKSLSGVDVRIIYDDVGTNFTKRELAPLKDAGMKFFVFNKLGFTFDASKNNRTHRKMIIIDGDVAFTGGFNIADEYVRIDVKYGVWQDAGMRFEGAAVHSFTVMFLSHWQLQKNAKPLIEDYCYAPSTECFHPESKGYVQPLSSGPINNYRLTEYAFMQLISEAKDHIYITTPYLIPDSELESELCLAARSGIDVRIIMPGIPDKKAVFGVTRSFYPTLINAGVKIYEYKYGFVHSKQVIVDGDMAYIGSCNFDYRSLFLHFECGAILYHTDTIEDMEVAFLDLLDECVERDKQWVKDRKWYQRFFRGLGKLFSPIL